MSKELSKIDKLASLDEFHFLLMEALHGIQPIQKEDLEFLCKHKSLNFMLSFENTLLFLSTLAVIDFQLDGSVAKSKTITWENIQSHQELSALILVRIFEYLDKKRLSQFVFGEKVIIYEQPGDLIVLYSNQMPLNFSCIKIFLLHAGIVIIDRNLPNRLVVDKHYEKYFRPILGSKPELPEAVVKISSSDTESGKAPQARGFNFFISYSFKDDHFKNELKSHFKGLINNGTIKAWDGKGILPGQDWDQEIKNKLKEADVILFLLSSDFMNSDYIKDVEIKNAIERHKRGEVRIVPVIIRPCDFASSLFSKFLAVPTDKLAISLWPNADEAYLDVVNHIKRMLDPT